jgi:hypothetical protein
VVSLPEASCAPMEKYARSCGGLGWRISREEAEKANPHARCVFSCASVLPLSPNLDEEANFGQIDGSASLTYASDPTHLHMYIVELTLTLSTTWARTIYIFRCRFSKNIITHLATKRAAPARQGLTPLRCSGSTATDDGWMCRLLRLSLAICTHKPV